MDVCPYMEYIPKITHRILKIISGLYSIGQNT
jgi:hypothetical protein